MRKTHEAFPRSRTSYFRFACFIFATSLLSESLTQAREKYIESMRKSAICFFPAIATHFFFLVLKLWRNSSGYIQNNKAQQQKLIWGFFHMIQFLSWHFTREPFRLLLTFHLSQHSYPNPNPKKTLTTPCEFSAILTFSPSLPFRPGSPGGPWN